MNDNNLLTPEGMDRIAEQYEYSLSNNKDLSYLVKEKKKQEINDFLNKLENYANSDNNTKALYLINLLKKVL